MTIGRANTVLVFGSGENAKALISAIIAKSLPETNTNRIEFKGPAQFSDKTKAHILETIVPLTHNLFSSLGLETTAFELSVINLEAAAVNDVGLTISGFSADVPVFLSILSAALGCEVPEHFVSTGHIASSDGDIRMVKHIPEKLTAAVLSKKTSCFIYPVLDQDRSLETLSPDEYDHTVTAVAKHKTAIQVLAVKNAYDLIIQAFTEYQVLMAGLVKGFWNRDVSSANDLSNTAKTVCHFSNNSYKRSWKVLEELLLQGKADAACRFFSALTSFYISRKTYPLNIGSSLFQLLSSLPPEKQRLTKHNQLISIDTCIKLSRFADEHQHNDVLLLYKAISADTVKNIPSTHQDFDTVSSQGSSILTEIISEINTDFLACNINQPIDAARSTYILHSVITASYDSFIDIITSFYIHLVRHTKTIIEPVDITAASAEALELLEKTFSGKGGIRTAFSEARDAINGGLRLILDSLTDQFKREQQEMHINRVLKLALDPLDWDTKVQIIKDLLEKLKHVFPQDLLDVEPEKYADHYETIVRTYVNSCNQLKSVIRCF